MFVNTKVLPKRLICSTFLKKIDNWDISAIQTKSDAYPSIVQFVDNLGESYMKDRKIEQSIKNYEEH